MASKACNYKNFSADLLNCTRDEPQICSAKSHGCKFSTLWITPVDIILSTIRATIQKVRSVATLYRYTTAQVFTPPRTPSHGSCSPLAGADMKAKKKSIRPLDALRSELIEISVKNIRYGMQPNHELHPHRTSVGRNTSYSYTNDNHR